MAEADQRWATVADDLTWIRRPDRLWQSEGRHERWFPGGTLNAAVNCVRRHLGDRPAIHWEGEPGDRRTLTFRELANEVDTFVTVLRRLDVGTGDRVALHLGWVPETVVAMLACAHIGAPFSLIPVMLPVEALAERLESLAPQVLFTQDGAWRHGTIIPTKSKVDDALTAVGGVQHTVVIRRIGLDVAWFEGDRWLHELLSDDASPTEPEPAPALPAEHPLLLSWLANRQGRPVLAVHSTASLLATATALHRYGLSSGGVFWCASDIGWMGAQVHGVLGPLGCGDTTVMFEGTVDTPNHRRLWDIIDRYQVRTLLTTPSVLTQVRSWTEGTPPEAEHRTLRRVVTMAEPLSLELRSWIAEKMTADQGAVADAWGQIELGAIVTVDSPVDAARLPDAGLVVVDAAGEPVPDGTPGEMVLRRPWAGIVHSIEGEMGYDHWGRRPGVYSTGDRAIRHPDGRLEFLGRIDPVVSVSGQLVSLAEIRDVLLEHPFLTAAEVVAVTAPRLGRRIVACVTTAPGLAPSPTLAAELVTTVVETLGGLARPRAILFLDRLGDDLPDDSRRRALEIVASSVGDRTTEITWAQVLAVSRLTE